MQFITIEEIKSEQKIAFNLYAQDFVFLFGYMLLTYFLSIVVQSKLKILFFIFSFCIALFLTMPSLQNRKRRIYQSVLLYLLHSNIVYKPLKNNLQEEEKKLLYEKIEFDKKRKRETE